MEEKTVNLETAAAPDKKLFLRPAAWGFAAAVVRWAILAVGLFVLGMSLTLMIKGHNIDSEISTNKNMQKLGIKCAVHETREADGGADCSDGQGVAGCSGNCGACDIEHISKNS